MSAIARLASAFSSRKISNRDSAGRVEIKSLVPRHRRMPVVEAMEGRWLMSVVLPGGTVPTPGTTLAARPELAGTVVLDNLIPLNVVDGSGNIAFAGVLQDRVVKETVSGTLDFYQTIRADIPANLPAFQGFIDNVTRTSFAGFQTDVDWRIDGLGTPGISPSQASRTATGNAVKFDFFKSITNGQMSYFYMIKTNATSFDLNGQTTLNFGSPAAALGASVTVPTAEPIGQPTTNPNQPTGGFGGTITVNPGPNGGTGQPLANTEVTLKISRGNNFSLIIIVKTDDAGHYHVDGLAPGHYDVQVLNPQGALGAGGGDAHGNDTASMMDVVVKPGRSSDGVNFILIGL